MDSNDLVFPITDALVDHAVFISIMDTLTVIFWLFSKLFFYYGFTMLYFNYLPLFEKEKVETQFKVLMALLFVATMSYGLVYLIDDVLVDTMYDVGKTETFGIYFVNTYPDPSASIEIVAAVAVGIDFLYVGYLGVCFISEAKRVGSNAIATKACILLSISSAALFVIVIATTVDSDIRFLFDSCQLLVDSLCLIFMFIENESTSPKYEIQSDAVDTEEEE